MYWKTVRTYSTIQYLLCFIYIIRLIHKKRVQMVIKTILNQDQEHQLIVSGEQKKLTQQLLQNIQCSTK